MNTPGPSFSPPPVPRRRLSFWAWAGIGCAGLTLLGFGGCASWIWSIVNPIRTEMAKPFVESEAIASIGDIPRYPDARIDPPGSKAARGLAMSWRRTIPADRHGVLALRSVEPVEKIADWYGTQMGKLGFQRREGEILKQSGLKRQMSWRRGKAMAMVQIKQDRKEDGVDTRIVLMRLDGLKDR